MDFCYSRIDSVNDCARYLPSNNLLKQKIQEVVQKPGGVEIYLDDSLDLAFGELGDSELKNLEYRSRHYYNQDDTATLYIVCGGVSKDNPTYIGSTYRESTIVLFYNKMRQFSSGGRTFTKIIESTILHELGHQLGLDHIDSEQCIMAPYVENLGEQNRVEEIPVEFCRQSLDRLEEIRSSLQ